MPEVIRRNVQVDEVIRRNVQVDELTMCNSCRVGVDWREHSFDYVVVQGCS